MRMIRMKLMAGYILLFGLLTQSCVAAESLLDKLGLQKSPPPAGNATTLATVLSQDEIAGGLKEALSKGVERAVASLGHEDGFLKDAAVKIPLPESLRKLELTLRKFRQDKLADEFVTTMNRAAEQAVPEAASVLANSVKQMTIADAKEILTGTNNAATQYFRRTSQTNLYERFLPIVRKATEQSGVTSAYKQMVAKASGGLGGFGASLLNLNSYDVDGYVTQKTLDGLFLKIADEEKRIRENPAARATDLLQKVFGAIGK